MGQIIDLKGKRFGRLAVIEMDEVKPKEGAYWLCRCDCGKETSVRGQSLRQGGTKSCGCLRDEQASNTHLKHGRSFDSLYKIWVAMKQRCENPNDNKYHLYGGRGISVCERWKDFQNFADDVGERPDWMSLDRIDNNGDYTPENCRWATNSEQGRNKRTTLMITYNGETLPLIEWVEQMNVPYERLRRRRRMGWTDTEIIEGR